MNSALDALIGAETLIAIAVASLERAGAGAARPGPGAARGDPQPVLRPGAGGHDGTQMTKRERERRVKQQRERRRLRDRERRIRRGAFIGAEAMLRSAAERLLAAYEPELLAHAQRVHQSVREKAINAKLQLLEGPPA